LTASLILISLVDSFGLQLFSDACIYVLLFIMFAN
jgi:hypothetical protein